jgi:hypothetical protein
MNRVSYRKRFALAGGGGGGVKPVFPIFSVLPVVTIPMGPKIILPGAVIVSIIQICKQL